MSNNRSSDLENACQNIIEAMDLISRAKDDFFGGEEPDNSIESDMFDVAHDKASDALRAIHQIQSL